MEVVGLVSGGKDSCYNMMCAVKAGHRIVALANLHPVSPGELDSYMYQSVGSEGIHMIAEAMELPLYRREIKGKPLNQDFDYSPTAGDEVEDLYELLKTVKEHHPSVQGVSAGAILSSYQKLRVEDVCKRLNLTPLCYLWERDQKELLREMISSGLDAVLVKVAAIGLDKKHLGMTLSEVESTLDRLHSHYGVHPCGEGGEYETFVLDCPLFHKRILIEESECFREEHTIHWEKKVIAGENKDVASLLKFIAARIASKQFMNFRTIISEISSIPQKQLQSP
ncbi:TIGR00289 family protein [Ancylostoma ceylanicum]|uniref:Diphthine--ammonia ligase n=1 Tax=Ancylostoma ceylanicum TaxID=53326 RepID=A0A0D6L7R1_9BILA|nr:TIGR00289 family protein [Ancylostoma ceylanicum]